MINQLKAIRILLRYFHRFIKLLRSWELTLKQAIRTMYYRLYFRLIKSHWQHSLELYVKWARKPLPDSYMKRVVKLGNLFSMFVGETKLCLDVGCGNGVIGGKTYDTVGYKYVNGNKIVGVDPLQLNGDKPSFLMQYTRGVCEHLAFKPQAFDTVVIATSLDHVQDVETSLRECGRVLKSSGTLNIWFTSLKQHPPLDPYHPNRVDEAQVFGILKTYKWKVLKQFREAWSESADTLFIKAEKNG